MRTQISSAKSSKCLHSEHIKSGQTASAGALRSKTAMRSAIISTLLLSAAAAADAQSICNYPRGSREQQDCLKRQDQAARGFACLAFQRLVKLPGGGQLCESVAPSLNYQVPEIQRLPGVRNYPGQQQQAAPPPVNNYNPNCTIPGLTGYAADSPHCSYEYQRQQAAPPPVNNYNPNCTIPGLTGYAADSPHCSYEYQRQQAAPPPVNNYNPNCTIPGLTGYRADSPRCRAN